MRVLLTGATGFLGSSLASALLAAGMTVIAIKRQISKIPAWMEKAGNLYFINFEDLDCSTIFESGEPPDAIIHTATDYGRTGSSFVEMYQSNVLNPLVLLEQAINSNTTVFINTDTVVDKYLNAYALTKTHFADWGRLLTALNKIRFINIRLQYLYGPGEKSIHFVASVIRACLTNQPEIRLTLGEQQRDFIFIDDAISAYLILLSHGKTWEPGFYSIDLGSGKTTTIREFVELVRKLTKSKTRLCFGAVEYRSGEMMHAVADNSYLMQLGWIPKIDLHRGLFQTIQYYCTNRN